ncbi:hypothetical protein [Ruegeria atlantica]|uniref:hypothetical protein n=1 Tax=Ruegeria atlantica TaxID=81569 RepID=UPI002494400B|nr:hypothetical protein [Ruegeria atlantica]
MNKEAREIIDGMIKQSGAISPCNICHNYDIWSDNDEAEKLVYAMATNEWKSGRFGPSSREDVMQLVKHALSDVTISCPSCG